MRGYKAFNTPQPNIITCDAGIQFCSVPAFVKRYQNWVADRTFILYEVETLDTPEPNNTHYICKWLRIVREIPREEFKQLCTGQFTDLEGYQYNYVAGQLTSANIDGRPAVSRADGYRAWYLADQLHRIGGPALIFANGDQYCYELGQLHRVDGPAAWNGSGYQAWYFRGRLHREGGPAMTFRDQNITEHWVHGVRID